MAQVKFCDFIGEEVLLDEVFVEKFGQSKPYKYQCPNMYECFKKNAECPYSVLSMNSNILIKHHTENLKRGIR